MGRKLTMDGCAVATGVYTSMTGVWLPAELRTALVGLAVRDKTTLSATMRRLLTAGVANEAR